MPSVLAFDPGGTTGWASVYVATDWFRSTVPLADEIDFDVVRFGQIPGPENEQMEKISRLMRKYQRLGSALVSERFTVRQFNQQRAFLAPVRLNACIDWFATCWLDPAVPIQWQDPDLAMGAWTDDRLKAAGLWTTPKRGGPEGTGGGGPHAMDALRHALTFLDRSRASTALRRGAWGDRIA